MPFRARGREVYHYLMAEPDNISIRDTSAEALLSLRHSVLRVGLPPESAVIDGDVEPTTHHIGAFDQSGQLVGCASLMRRPWDDQTSWPVRCMAILRLIPRPPTPGEAAWRLRGMAVVSDLRGRGIGRLMLANIEQFVRTTDYSRLLWCCARKPVVGYYAAMGWTKIGAEFYVKNVGPHFTMFKRLGRNPAYPSGNTAKAPPAHE